MSKATVVFVINSLQRGGAERVVSVLGNSLDQKTYKVIIVCMNEAEQAYQVSKTVTVVNLLHRTGKETIFNRVKYGLLTFFRLLKLLLKEKPYCAISFMTSANLWTGISCKLLNIQYIVSERTTPDHTINEFGFLLKWISYVIYRESKAIVIPSKGIEDCMKQTKVFQNLKNYKVIRNPINIFKISSNIKVHPKKFILGVGRLGYEKGFDQLILAFGSLKFYDIDLLIVGDGIEKQNLNELITKLNLQNRVYLVGAKNELLDYYKQAELFVLPSRNEGYPNALIEAMSNGCACVAMNCEFGPSEIIKNGVNGLLVENNNIHLLSKAIFKILINPIFKEKLSLNAKQICQTNSLDAISRKWEELILCEN
ncbi:glycosyltransferase involved in cell wall biosynthesis [Pedobacter sp. CG_S7]|uniref:glycosyltransferase n=1 Tax=Pedobacter sp. CG_S7 TaxID=3143930 RepID=UPI003396B848